MIDRDASPQPARRALGAAAQHTAQRRRPVRSSPTRGRRVPRRRSTSAASSTAALARSLTTTAVDLGLPGPYEPSSELVDAIAAQEGNSDERKPPDTKTTCGSQPNPPQPPLPYSSRLVSPRLRRRGQVSCDTESFFRRRRHRSLAEAGITATPSTSGVQPYPLEILNIDDSDLRFGKNGTCRRNGVQRSRPSSTPCDQCAAITGSGHARRLPNSTRISPPKQAGMGGVSNKPPFALRHKGE